MKYLSGVCALIFLFLIPMPLMAGDNDTPSVSLASPPKISAYIDYTKGRKRLVYIYTSWCPACRKKMPKIKDMERVKEGSVIAISVDEDYSQFSKYMKKDLRDAPFRLILNKGAESSLEQQLLKDHKIQPWTSYPTMILLDENNKVKKQGYLNTDEVARFLLSK